MALELVYTSVRKGLKPGTSGFCTVAHTRGMLPAAIRLAESLSGYRHVPGGLGGGGGSEPVAISHYRAMLGGESLSILSRVGFCGKDHTNRDNKLAHHILVNANERPLGGPAWLSEQDIFITQWDEEPHLLETPRVLPAGTAAPGVCERWAALTGDAGWGGVAAQSFLTSPNTVVYMVYEPGLDIMGLMAESLALIPEMKRWLVTFCTYFSALPPGMTCAWRGCLPGQAFLRDPRARANSVVIDLTAKPPAPPADTYFVRLARGESPSSAMRMPGEGARRTERDTGFVKMPDRHRRELRFRPEK